MIRILIVVLSCGMAVAQVAPSAGGTTPPQDPPKESASTSPDTAALIPEPPPLPGGKVSLIGGTVSRLDRVRDQVTVHIFGGKDLKVLFDGRTRVYRDGSTASYRDLQSGQRVYLDTVLDGTKIFARNIHIVSARAAGESSGQVLSFDRNKGELMLRDAILPQPLKLHVGASTRFLRDGQPVSSAELHPGTLISATLYPDGGGAVRADQVTILATPGKAFVFAGRVIHLDIHTGLLVLVDPRDKKTYEIHFDTRTLPVSNDLQQGSDVTATADFDGTRYFANSIVVNAAPAQ